MNHPYTLASRRFACLSGALIFVFAAACVNNSKTDTAEAAEETASTEASLPDKHDFNHILETNMLPAVYKYDAEELEKQQQYPATLTADAAFGQGVKALFSASTKPGATNFYAIVMADPDAYGLTQNPIPSQVKNTIREKLLQDHAFQIALLPDAPKEGFEFAAPKKGEKTMDYWIWHVNSDGFGPSWIIVRRDGSEGAYSYAEVKQ